MKTKNLKKVVFLAILLSMCIAISLIDNLISKVIFVLPFNIKIGLSNVIIIFVMYQFGFKESLIIDILKSVISGLLFNGIISFVIGGIASLISYLVMYLLYRFLKENITPISISFVGGMTNIIVQLFIVSFIYQLGEYVIYYGIYLIIISMITSIIVGVLALLSNKFLSKYLNKEFNK